MESKRSVLLPDFPPKTGACGPSFVPQKKVVPKTLEPFFSRKRKKRCEQDRVGRILLLIMGILLCITLGLTIFLNGQPREVVYITKGFQASTTSKETAQGILYNIKLLLNVYNPSPLGGAGNKKFAKEVSLEWENNGANWQDVFVSSFSNPNELVKYSGFRLHDNPFRFISCHLLQTPPQEEILLEEIGPGFFTSVVNQVFASFQGNQTTKQKRIELLPWTWNPILSASNEGGYQNEDDILLNKVQSTFLQGEFLPAYSVCHPPSIQNPVLVPLHQKIQNQSTHLTSFKMRQKDRHLSNLQKKAETKMGVSPFLMIVTSCTPDKKGNGVCDDICNDATNEYDNGDCCTSVGEEEWRYVDCKTGPKVLLLHGASVHVRDSKDLLTQFSDVSPSIEKVLVEEQKIWGDLPRYLKGFASQIIYNAHNTYDFGWTSLDLQRAYYNKSLEIIEEGGVVFAHSLANLVLAGACKDQGLCQVKWYAVAPPFRGARVTQLSFPVNGVSLDLNNTGVLSMRPSSNGLYEGALAKVVDEHELVLGILCGLSAFGSGDWPGAEFTQLTKLTTNEAPWIFFTDGIVSLAECALSEPPGESLPKNIFDPSQSIPWQNIKSALGNFEQDTSKSFALVFANHHDLAGGSKHPWTFQQVLRWYASALNKG
jgi:hypothetical protein